MSSSDEERIRGILVNIISDGFNRSIGTLEEAGAIDTKKMRTEYKGIGSKYYDLVTEEIEYTAKYGARGVLELLENLKLENK
jgi:hypothetical protein